LLTRRNSRTTGKSVVLRSGGHTVTVLRVILTIQSVKWPRHSCLLHWTSWLMKACEQQRVTCSRIDGSFFFSFSKVHAALE